VALPFTEHGLLQCIVLYCFTVCCALLCAAGEIQLQKAVEEDHVMKACLVSWPFSLPMCVALMFQKHV
jgi:TRAP-type C4-dicarboxylate transport system permease small subunit